jgi:geranylgeranyl diphosphate synthase, type II
MSFLIPSSRINRLQKTIEVGLHTYLGAYFAGPTRLIEATRHAVWSPGKRLRATLCLLIAEDLDCFDVAVPAACALEFLHTASLIIDDLPCMDDEKERRGRPATHLAYGQDIAILAAFSLVSQAFGVISTMPSADARISVHLTSLFSEALGANGLCAGQARDLASISETATEEEYKCTVMQKTASLFILAVLCGSAFAKPALSEAEQETIKCFGTNVGLAFQAHDDYLDNSGSFRSTTLICRANAALSAAGKEAKKLTRIPSLESYLASPTLTSLWTASQAPRPSVLQRQSENFEGGRFE